MQRTPGVSERGVSRLCYTHRAIGMHALRQVRDSRIRRQPAGPHIGFFPMSAPDAAFDLPLGYFTDTVLAEEIDEGADGREHSAARRENELNFEERRGKFRQQYFEVTIAYFVQAHRQGQ